MRTSFHAGFLAHNFVTLGRPRATGVSTGGRSSLAASKQAGLRAMTRPGAQTHGSAPPRV
jgi:hypothetical protein